MHINVKLYFSYLTIHFKSQIQYRLSFFLSVFGRILASLATITEILFIFARFKKIEGFTLNQTLLCSSIVLMAFTFTEIFARGFDVFPKMLGNGEFDRILVRPHGVIFQILTYNMDFARLGLLFESGIILFYAIFTSGISWTWDKILTLILMIICGTITFFSLYLLYAGISFFTIEGLEFMNILTHGGKQFGRYPYSIYGEKVLKFLTFVVPLALFQYYPFLYLLGREKNIMYIFSPLGAAFFLIPSYFFFYLGLHKYKSTGS